jgi:hypothetical protein
VQVVQFVGKAMTYNDATELIVTRAIISTSMTVCSRDRVVKHSQKVDSIMQKHGLVHIGWMRAGSREQTLTLSDVRTQQVGACFTH